MGKPKKVSPAQVDTNYNWGDFGSANKGGVSLSPTASANVSTTQSGINQYLNELINPSYNNESFRARQALLDANNRQYANELGAQAIARGARGSATQNILNSVMANRNTQMQQAMTQEDQRVQNILSQLGGVENNYFNQANTMANNILSRVSTNAANQQQANMANTQAYNQWKNNLLSSGIGAAGLVGGLALGGAPALAGTAAKSVMDVNGNVLGSVGGYGSYNGGLY